MQDVHYFNKAQYSVKFFQSAQWFQIWSYPAKSHNFDQPNTVLTIFTDPWQWLTIWQRIAQHIIFYPAQYIKCCHCTSTFATNLLWQFISDPVERFNSGSGRRLYFYSNPVQGPNSSRKYGRWNFSWKAGFPPWKAGFCPKRRLFSWKGTFSLSRLCTKIRPLLCSSLHFAQRCSFFTSVHGLEKSVISIQIQFTVYSIISMFVFV